MSKIILIISFIFCFVVSKPQNYYSAINSIRYGNCFVIDDGQSNAALRGDTSELNSIYKINVTNAYTLTASGMQTYQWNVNHTGRNGGNANSCGYTNILIPILAEFFDTVIIADRGTGSTSLYSDPLKDDHNFYSSNELHKDLMDDINTAKTFISDNNINIDYYFHTWNQGENDGYDSLTWAQAYDTSYVTKALDIQDSLPNIRIIDMLINTNAVGLQFVDTVNNRKLSARDSLRTQIDYDIIDLNLFTLGGDNLHYSASGYTEIAKAIKQKIFQMIRGSR